LTKILFIAIFLVVKQKDKKKENLTEQFSVKLPISLLEKVREKSARTGISIAFVLRRALEEWVQEKQK
jgi:hypothetical protein